MKYEKLARFIIKNVGGEKNINIVQHCATRLRFELKDEEKVNKVNLENSSEILQVLFSGGQCQVVIGTHVADGTNFFDIKPEDFELVDYDPVKPQLKFDLAI